MSEIRALLLTDVVDSTKLSESLGDDAMAEVWAGHDRVARDLLTPWRGREIDKTDGMLLMFDTAADAVSYALAYHRALGSLPIPLKARAGLHVGPVILRENNPEDVARGAKPLEVDGLAKPTAARVMTLAQGAQTLMTNAAREALGETGLQVASHGHWMMKGVADPLELFEVALPEARMVPPPDSDKVYRVIRVGEWWLPVKEIPNNLPQQATSFMGREREIDEVKALLPGAKLVTLLGMGGLGKTRLSLEVAAQVMHQYPDGVWFLDLAPISDAALVVAEAAQLLGVREEPDRTLIQSVSAYLKTRRVLLVFDNCEHLVKPSADLAHAIVKAAPQVRVIASSREALHIPGERAYPILPLPVPKAGDSVAVLLQLAAVRLFVARAQAHKPSFELNAREAPAVAELVARLEGIPLALELAAARVRALSVADINTRLKDRYKILTGGSRVLQERQQTLRALVDWSYDMLREEEQTLLQRLAVFVGGFDLGASEGVCGVDPISSDDVMDLLASLVEKSLVMMEERDDGTRYRMLETIRDYAREKLDQSGDTEATAASHCQHYFAVAKEVRDGLRGPEQPQCLQRMETELDNLRAATALALSGGVDSIIAVKLAVAMQGFWILCGYATEGRNVVRAALAMPEVTASDQAHAFALYVGAALAESQGDYEESRQMLETCLELRRRLGNPIDIAATLSTLSMARMPLGDGEGARAGETEALAIFRDKKNRVGEAIGLLHLGQIELHLGNAAQAQTHLEQCLTVARAIKHPETEGECELMLGEIAFEAGGLPLAAKRFARSLSICQAARDRRGVANALWWSGRTELQSGDTGAAWGHLGEALRAFQNFEMREQLLGCLEDHASLALAGDQNPLAGKIMAAATALRERMKLARRPHDEARWQLQLNQLRERLGAEAYDEAWETGLGLETDEAIRLSLSMPGAPVLV
jgi:predicted ATPase/class 3 adenylate cyclase